MLQPVQFQKQNNQVNFGIRGRIPARSEMTIPQIKALTEAMPAIDSLSSRIDIFRLPSKIAAIFKNENGAPDFVVLSTDRKKSLKECLDYWGHIKVFFSPLTEGDVVVSTNKDLELLRQSNGVAFKYPNNSFSQTARNAEQDFENGVLDRVHNPKAPSKAELYQKLKTLPVENQMSLVIVKKN